MPMPPTPSGPDNTDQTHPDEIATLNDALSVIPQILTESGLPPEYLGLNTIAEGVEAKEQLAYLYERGRIDVQGYYYSKPLPEDAFGTLYREYDRIS